MKHWLSDLNFSDCHPPLRLVTLSHVGCFRIFSLVSVGFPSPTKVVHRLSCVSLSVLSNDPKSRQERSTHRRQHRPSRLSQPRQRSSTSQSTIQQAQTIRSRLTRRPHKNAEGVFLAVIRLLFRVPCQYKL